MLYSVQETVLSIASVVRLYSLSSCRSFAAIYYNQRIIQRRPSEAWNGARRLVQWAIDECSRSKDAG